MYVVALFWLGILPAKVKIQEVTVKDYKVNNKVKMVFAELSYINESHSKSIEEIKENKTKIENKLPELKSNRENLWRKVHKASFFEEKSSIKERIDLVTDEINRLYGQKNACNRIIATYNRVYKKVQKEIDEKEKVKELINKSKKNKSRML